MSEEFDKEAEREKLRQQLAAEEESRQATQHMSELLLKGATMTNRHCDDCGDPVFRHEGREFCPTCGTQGGAAASEAGDAGATSEEGGTATAASEGPPPGSQPADAPTPQQAGPVAGSPSDTPQPPGGADLPAAREALARKVTALAQEAEATSDVGRARELLAAVREGAEALRALEGQR